MKNSKKNMIIVFALFVTISIVQSAEASSVFTEIDSIMTNILDFLTSPFAWFVCIGSAAIALAGWAISDGGGNMIKTGSRIAIVFAILFNLTAMIGRVYSASQGLGIL